MSRTFTPDDDVAAIIGMIERQLDDPQASLALVVRMKLPPDAEREASAAFDAARSPTLAEDGAMAFELHREPGRPNGYLVYERWRDLGSLERHLRMPNVAALRSRLNGLLLELPEIEVLKPLTGCTRPAQSRSPDTRP
jgi:quinol monooxygenase YgiN